MHRRQATAATGLAIVAVWAWFASGVRTFTHPAEVLTFVPGIAVLAVTLHPRARPRVSPRREGEASAGVARGARRTHR